MKNAAGLGFGLLIFAIGGMIGIAFASSFYPDPHNPPPLSWVLVGIYGTILFSGCIMIVGSDLDNDDPNDRILVGRPPIVERKPE
jgi:hypothetical protein